MEALFFVIIVAISAGPFWPPQTRSANSSSKRRPEKYRVDRLVLEAMVDEPAKALISGGTAVALGQRVEDNAFHLRKIAKVSTPNASRLGCATCGTRNRTQHNREIERKFLVKWLPDNLKRSRHFIIEQGYLATESAGQTGSPAKNGEGYVSHI